MLRRGDRVKLTSPRYTWIKLSPGAMGSVLRDVDAGDTVGVSFDDWQGGHNAEGLLKDNSGWFLNIEDVEAINESIPAGSTTQSATAISGVQGPVQQLQAPARRGGAHKSH